MMRLNGLVISTVPWSQNDWGRVCPESVLLNALLLFATLEKEVFVRRAFVACRL